MNELDIFLNEIEDQIALSREKIIRDNQKRFEELVKNILRKGDKLFVANGTVYLKRGKQDNTMSDSLERATLPIRKGVYEIGFDFDYKTEIK